MRIEPTATPVELSSLQPEMRRTALVIIERINADRRAAGVGTLVEHPNLTLASLRYAELLARTPGREYVTGSGIGAGSAHIGPDGSSPRSRAVAAGYCPPDPTPSGNYIAPPCPVFENIGQWWAFGSPNELLDKADTLHNHIMSSQPHRENALHRLHIQIGLGCAIGRYLDKWILWCVEMFGTSR